MNIKPISNKVSHHYFTSAPKMNPNEENEIWHCPFCANVGTWSETVDHVIDCHQDKMKSFIKILKG